MPSTQTKGALDERSYYSRYPELPSPASTARASAEDGLAAYEAHWWARRCRTVQGAADGRHLGRRRGLALRSDLSRRATPRLDLEAGPAAATGRAAALARRGGGPGGGGRRDHRPHQRAVLRAGQRGHAHRGSALRHVLRVRRPARSGPRPRGPRRRPRRAGARAGKRRLGEAGRTARASPRRPGGERTTGPPRGWPSSSAATPSRRGTPTRACSPRSHRQPGRRQAAPGPSCRSPSPS